METSVAAATVLGALLGLVSRKGHGKMARLVSYLWLCVTASLAFFVRFLARRLFRPRREEESHEDGSFISASVWPSVSTDDAGKHEEKEEEEQGEEEENGAGEERETPVFQFKFSFQIPEQSINSRGVQGGSAGEDGVPSTVTSISQYRFFSEGGCRRLVEAPQAMTLRVQESYMGSDGVVWSSSAEELDGELKGRFSSVKVSREADAGISVDDELDRELRNRLLSMKFSRRYDSHAGAAEHEEEQDRGSLSPDNLSTVDVSEELELCGIRLPDDGNVLAGGWLLPVVAGGLSGFNTDSDWESRSDGYSVKDLIQDFDSDGLFSERDLEAEVDRARFLGLNGEEVYVKFKQKTKATQLTNSVDSDGSSEDFDRESIELSENAKNSSIEIKLVDMPNSICSSDDDDMASDEIVQRSRVKLDRELKSRFSLVKHYWQADPDTKIAKQLDRKLKNRLFSMKFSQRYDSDDRGAVPEEREYMSLHPDNLSRADVPEELELLDARFLDEAGAPASVRLSPVRAGDVSGFSLDSDSESRSDGYSVKDLILDFDSDGLFTEKDFQANVDKAIPFDLGGGGGYYVKFEQKSKSTQSPNLPDSVKSPEDFDEEDKGLPRTRKNSTEIKMESLHGSISSSDLHDESISDGDLLAAELEIEKLLQKEVDRKEAINDYLSSDELSSITSQLGLDTEPLWKHQPTGILSESGQEGTNHFGVEESESLEKREPEEIWLLNSSGLDKESPDFGIKNQNMKNPNLSNQVLPEEAPAASYSSAKHVDGQVIGDVAEAGESSDEPGHGLEHTRDSEETHLGETSEDLSMEEMEELESLWEHEDLIDQLKVDLRKARATGLSTIPEESESLRPAEGLHPWKPEAQFLREDPMDELHKLYKSYRERMKKLDVLNRQKMYAIGFFQLKDPLKSMGTQKHSIPAITSILSQNFCRQKSSIGPSEKFIKELQSDLEAVYVAQSCLSWEFLHWQYERTRELLGSDPHDGRQYNQVAEDFQQFQVLIQRFLEDEPFQGPRVPNYVKNRCNLRRLLQVPLVREDCFKDKVDEKRKRKDAITGEQLEYIMEDSIRIFWEFVRSDKDETPLIVKGLFGTHVELQDPTDLHFMVDIQASLKQKQKKLRDVLRIGNCLVRKFKKPQQGRSNQDDLFFSQVDLKLVSRVLKLTRITTDQLVWCHKKLSKISFVDRKLLREPSFLLFPC